MSRWVDNLLYKMRKRRFCKLNGWFCPDCIYHDFIFEGAIFRGNKCRYPRQTEQKQLHGCLCQNRIWEHGQIQAIGGKTDDSNAQGEN